MAVKTGHNKTTVKKDRQHRNEIYDCLVDRRCNRFIQEWREVPVFNINSEVGKYRNE